MPFSRESAGTLTAAQSHVDLACAGYGGAGIRLSGTFTGTVTFEGSVDGRQFDTLTMLLFDGSTTATTATAAGQWVGPCAGLTVVRVRMSAYTNGTAVAYLLAAEPSGARVGGGGGGGGTPASPTTSVQFNNAGSFGGSASFAWDGTTVAAPSVLLAGATGVQSLIVRQTDGWASYTAFDAASARIMSVFDANLTTYVSGQNTYAGTLIETQINLSSNPNATFTAEGLDMAIYVPVTHTATWPASSSIRGGNSHPWYAGTTALPRMWGLTVISERGTTGAVTTGDITTVDSITTEFRNNEAAGTTGQLTGVYNKRPVIGAGHTVSGITAGFYTERQDAVAGTQTGGTYGFYAAGTADKNFFAGGVIAPTVTGGSATTQDLTFQTTSGVGVAGADMHFLVGNNGATEAETILNSGFVGINQIAPTTIFHLTQNSGFGTNQAGYTGALSSYTVGLFRSAVTTNPAAIAAVTVVQGLVADMEVSLTTNTANFTAYIASNSLAVIQSTDTAVYSANSFLEGAAIQAQYDGSGSIPNVIGATVAVNRGLTGGVTTAMTGIAVTSAAAAGASSGTVALLRMISIQRPTGTAGATYTNAYGLDIGNMTPTNVTLTNVSRALRIQDQTGTGAYAIEQLGTDDLVFWGSKFSTYANVTTTGWGVGAIYASGRVTAQSAANASIATYTVGAADGSFRVSANLNATAVTTLVTTLTCTYTDESNTARTMIFPVAQLSGSFISGGAITGTGAWETPAMHIRCKAGSVITILTSAGTFTGVTYTAEGCIEQIA